MDYTDFGISGDYSTRKVSGHYFFFFFIYYLMSRPLYFLHFGHLPEISKILPKVRQRSHFLQRVVIFGFWAIIWWCTIYLHLLFFMHIVRRCNAFVLNIHTNRWCEVLWPDFWVNMETCRWCTCMSMIQTPCCRVPSVSVHEQFPLDRYRRWSCHLVYVVFLVLGQHGIM